MLKMCIEIFHLFNVTLIWYYKIFTFLGATTNMIVPIWINGQYVQVFCDFETGKFTFKPVITEVFNNILSSFTFHFITVCFQNGGSFRKNYKIKDNK